MTLHLVKLCVGAESIADHEAWIREKLAAMKARGETPSSATQPAWSPSASLNCSTEAQSTGSSRADRVASGNPRRAPIYGRRGRLPLPSRAQAQGDPGCAAPDAPVSGLAYLSPHEAPPDLTGGLAEVGEMPDAMRKELRELGLL